MATGRDFAADRALCDAATPGPWIYTEPPDEVVEMPSLHGAGGVKVLDFGSSETYYPECGTPPGDADASFIAAAREGWPAALAEVERLRAAMAQTYCAYCGFEVTIDDAAGTIIGEHVRGCEKHPMRAVEVENARLRAALVAITQAEDARDMHDTAVEALKQGR